MTEYYEKPMNQVDEAEKSDSEKLMNHNHGVGYALKGCGKPVNQSNESAKTDSIR